MFNPTDIKVRDKDMKNRTLGNISTSSINLNGDKFGDKASIKGTLTETSNGSGTVLSEGMSRLATKLNMKGQLTIKIPCLHNNSLGKQVSMLERLNVNGWDRVRVSDGKSKATVGNDAKHPLSYRKQYRAKVQGVRFVQPRNGGGKVKINIYPTVKIRLLNSQGFDEAKYQELENKYLADEVYRERKEYNLICLTETQERVEKVKINDAVFRHSIMRRSGEKKGGGLKVLGRVDSRVGLNPVRDVKCNDILALEGIIFGLELRLILVYFDCTKLTSGDDFKRNRDIEDEVIRLLKNNSKQGALVLGDFNGHLRVLEGDRGIDENGKMIVRLMEEFNLQLMNADKRCKGKYTWGRGGQRSAIDMILVNTEVFGYCGLMTIDEDGLEINFSDHNMVTLELRLRERGNTRYGKKGDKKGKVMKECIRKDKGKVDMFLEGLRSKWVEGMGFIEMWDNLVKTQNAVLAMKLSLRTGLRKGGKAV